MLRAFSTVNGHIAWEHNTVQEPPTVISAAAKGGSMGAPGHSVAGGMLSVNSGYTFFTGVKPGNVFLAFPIE